MSYRTILRAMTGLGAIIATLGSASVSLGQLCNCTCDATIPACYGIARIFMNESGGAPANPNPYLSAGIGTIPPTSAEVRHANRLFITPGTTITHLCVSLRNPSSPSHITCAGGDQAFIFIATHDATSGLPGGIIGSTITNFIVAPCQGTAVNHQLIAFNTPQHFPLGADLWFGVGYPTADVNIGHQGSRPRTGGNSAVWIGGTLSQWYDYEDPQLGSFNGKAPIIRALEVVRGGGRLDVFPSVGLVTDENGLTAQFDVHLAPAPPLSNVTVTLMSSNPAEGQPLTAMLTFTPADYNIAQTVTVLGQDDPIIDGPQSYEINLIASSLDPCYDQARERVSLTNYDNDAPCQLRWTNISAPAGSPPDREGHAMAFDPLRNRVVMFGGRDTLGLPLADTWEFDVANSAWVQILPPPGPAPRWRHAMAFDPQLGMVVLTGGDDTLSNVFPESWGWNGAVWVPLAPWPGLPTYHHAMCFNQPMGNIVMFGGEGPGGVPLPDVWESVPGPVGGWAPGFPMVGPGGPDPRGALAAATSPAGPVVFGGLHLLPGITYGDTWLYIPGGWQQVTPPTSPGPRHQHSMASFSARPGSVVLFGGQDSVGNFLNETWLFDSALLDWNPQVIAGPSARMLTAMAEIESQGRVLLFGGRIAGNVTGDTWLLEDLSQTTVSGPSDGTVVSGNVFSMAISYVGSGPFMFQWFHNSLPLTDGPTVSGSQTDTLTIGPATIAHEGNYWCEVTDACGNVTVGTIAFLDVLCRADFNGDGVVNVPDIFAFLAAWFAQQHPDADFNQDGVINVPDIFAFLAAWFAGC